MADTTPNDQTADPLPEVSVPSSPKAAAPTRKILPNQFVATIRAGGAIYGAWESFRVRREIGNPVSTFTFVAAEGGYGPNQRELKLDIADTVEIWLNDEKVLQGSVTNRAVAFDKSSHQVVISGKCITNKITKTSVPIVPGSFSGSTFEQVTRAMLQPHGIGLRMVNPPAIASMPFRWLAAMPGEMKSELIERLRPHRGLFVWDDANGNLLAGQGDPSEASTADLVEGRNILSLSGSINNDTAFGAYAAISQTPGDDDNLQGRDSSAARTNPGGAADEKRVVTSPHTSSSQELAGMLDHFQAESLWRQVNIAVTVVGWFRPDGKLWEPIRNVSLYSPMFFPKQTSSLKLGIQAVEWAQDPNEGSTTTLTLMLTGALNGSLVHDVPDVTGSSGVASAQKSSTVQAVPDPPDTATST